jgi:hypothetical protein
MGLGSPGTNLGAFIQEHKAIYINIYIYIYIYIYIFLKVERAETMINLTLYSMEMMKLMSACLANKV